MNRPPIAFALDFPDGQAARAMAGRLRDSVGMFKVGLELFVAEGPAVVRDTAALGLPVFLDLKLHDIPETVERAVAKVASLGAQIVTIHAGGGAAMLERAAARAHRDGVQIAAVTVLTSLDDKDLTALAISEDSRAHALRLAKLAFDCGVTAFVCSPHEVAALRGLLGKAATLITPGVRPAASEAGDQKRVMTPGEAVRNGADWVVVGRPIRDAADPVQAAASIASDMASAKSR